MNMYLSKNVTNLLILILLTSFSASAQLLQDDFEGNSTIVNWLADASIVESPFPNPLIQGINTSANVLKYEDNGGQYANVFFNSPIPIVLGELTPFTLKIYVPSASITGNQPNQVSLKLQNGQLNEPWVTQTEIIKPIQLDVWQEISFDFANDNFINLDSNSPNPLNRNDFNRVLIQVNGENNNDLVTAYIDDFYFEGEASNGGENNDPMYDMLVWSDEFETDGPINSEKWHHQTILPNGSSWFNGEIQHYTDRTENSYVENGILHIVAKNETFTDQGVTKNYTSARLNSKFAFTYGRVEVKAKLPTGVGTWPAIWMLGKNISELGTFWDLEGYGTTPWPACGEIDIMEHWGSNQNYISSAMHTPSSFGGTVNHGGQVIPTASTDYHVYTLDWYEDRMVFSVDNVVHYVYQPEVQNEATWPFTEDQFILLNIAIEPSIASSFTEDSMDIEYVRVYQEDTNLSTNEIAKDEISLSPNPFSSHLNIQITNESLGSDFYVYNLQGKKIHQFKATQNRIDLDTSHWSKGFYIVKQISDKTSSSFKVLKQ